MKIALFLRRIGPYHHARFKAAVKEIDLHVVETRPGSQEYPWEFEPDNKYARYRLGVAKDPEKGFRGRTLIKKVREVIERINPDVVITVGWADAEYHAVLLEADREKIPVGLISDSTLLVVKRYQLLEWFKKRIVKKFGAALTAGSRGRAYLVNLGMDPKKIFFAWDVVDNDLFLRKSKEVNKDQLEEYGIERPYFLCVARFIPEKNLETLIKAYKKYVDHRREKKEDFYLLVLVGSGPLFDAIEKARDKYNLQNEVILTGFVQIDNIPRFYAFAKWLILPSQSETWGLAVNEAFASGLPAIVSTQCGCTDDLIIERENGFTYDSHNSEALLHVLNEVHEISDEEYALIKSNCLDQISKYSLSEFSYGLKLTIEECIMNSKKYNLLGYIISKTLVRV